MRELLLLALIGSGAAAMLALGWWLERATNRPGLHLIIGSIILLTAAGVGLAGGYRLLPLLLAVQAAIFLYQARWRRSAARETKPIAHPQQK